MGELEDVEISVVVPVYNEEANLSILIRKLVEVFNRLGSLYEMIFVDDGSSDGSRKVLKEMAYQGSVASRRGLETESRVSARLFWQE